MPLIKLLDNTFRQINISKSNRGNCLNNRKKTQCCLLGGCDTYRFGHGKSCCEPPASPWTGADHRWHTSAADIFAPHHSPCRTHPSVSRARTFWTHRATGSANLYSPLLAIEWVTRSGHLGRQALTPPGCCITEWIWPVYKRFPLGNGNLHVCFCGVYSFDVLDSVVDRSD